MQKHLKSYPKRGEIFVADLDPGYGHEMHKKRPVLIISNSALNQVLPTVITIPFSSIVPKFIGPDVVKIIDLKIGLNKESALIINQMRSIDKSRLVKKIGTLSSRKQLEVDQALKLVLGLEPLE